MCELCLVHPDNYGEVFPGWTLIKAQTDGMVMKAGQWGLVRSNEPSFVWDDEPVIDRLVDCSEDAINAMPKEKFLEIEREFWDPCNRFGKSFKSDPRSGYELYEAAINVGYSPKNHGHIEWWLFDRMARHIRDNKPTNCCLDIKDKEGQ